MSSARRWKPCQH